MQFVEKMLQKADKIMKSRFRVFGNKYQDAYDLYEKVVTAYKLNKFNGKAIGDIYVKMAECQVGLKSDYEAANCYRSAAESYGATYTAINTYDKAIEKYIDSCNIIMAARCYHKQADLCCDMYCSPMAVERYQKAADIYLTENNPFHAIKCYTASARISAVIYFYDKAVNMFESVLKLLDNSSMGITIREIILSLCLCHLCRGDSVSCSKTMELDPYFDISREGKLVKRLLETYQRKDVTEFAQCVYDYDQLSKLDQWSIQLLLRIRRSMEESDFT